MVEIVLASCLVASLILHFLAFRTMERQAQSHAEERQMLTRALILEEHGSTMARTYTDGPPQPPARSRQPAS